LSKTELIDRIAEECDLNKADSKRVLESVFGAIADSLTGDGRFSYHGFGTFTVRERSARMGRNPQTGESMQIQASKTVKFKVSSGLKDSL